MVKGLFAFSLRSATDDRYYFDEDLLKILTYTINPWIYAKWAKHLPVSDQFSQAIKYNKYFFFFIKPNILYIGLAVPPFGPKENWFGAPLLVLWYGNTKIHVLTHSVASRNNFLGGCPLHWCDATEYIQQEINNDNSHKTVMSRLTFISAFSIMVTVTLMKTAVAKNLSQSIIICVEHQNFPKVFDNPVNILFFGGCPGIPWLP